MDPTQEQERLANRYAAMNDLELMKVGHDPNALTEWARRALKSEMDKRGLAEAEATVETEAGGKPVILRVYRDMPAALVDKSVLDAAGVPCFLQDANVVRMDWMWSNAIGGIKLVVSEADVQDAAKILDSRLDELPADAEE